MSSGKNIVDLQAVASLIKEDSDLENNVHRLPNTPMSATIEQHKPDQELLDSTARIRNQRDLILSRIEKMNSHKETVTETVFQKVQRDYQLQLDNINKLLSDKKAELKQELKNLYLAHQKIQHEINRHQEILEEARFRHYLEEFSEEQYKEVEEFEAREIAKLQSESATLESFMKVHEELFDPEDLGKKAVATPPTQEAQPQQVTQTMHVPQTQPQPIEVPEEQPVEVVESSEPTTFDYSDEDLNQQLDKTDANIEENNQINPEELTSNVENQDYFESPPENTPEISMASHLDSTDDEESKIENKPEELTIDNEKSFLADSEGSVSEILEDIDIENQLSNSISPEPTPTESGTAGHKLVFKPGELNADIDEFELKDNTSIGRSPSNDLVLRAPKMSRQHAAINKYKDQYIVIDLKSSNGVYVNGRKVDEHPLENGDELSIGGYKMVFEKN